MATLLIAEHDNASIKDATLKALTAGVFLKVPHGQFNLAGNNRSR